ncbi:zonular occludens toxin [Salmonella enterica]|nr:zonular occludens toxin [Salmonella enterica]ECZ5385819.1 zonular occludens toxin [Salmonella enterica subsp. enterica serovar Montevideo]ECF6666792.1 zonular occludens toxin [Salmonella enterica]EFS0969296.1 zonular occludens toxin [Salmonella enterica]EGG9433592.1 zonular occludens toxin [Salmonella enterica]
MAITAYIGLPGSGKSYEMVRSVIIPALKVGRRIVTNVYGVDNEKIKQYILKDKNLEPDSLGELIFVTNEQVLKPDFYPVSGVDNPVVQAGDLIILDECHRFFASDKDMTQQAKIFAAEHRHYVNAQGHTSDLVVVNQALGTLCKFLKERIETTYRMTKLIALGFDNRYRVDVFSGCRLSNANKINSYQEKYRPEIYSLYSSYDGANASEQRIDSRARVFKKSTIFYFFVFVAFAVWAVMTYVVPIFTGQSWGIKKTTENKISQTVSDTSQQQSVEAVSQSVEWCISGIYFDGNRNFVLLKDTSGHLRMVSRNTFQGDGIMLHGVVDGQQVNTWSCNNGGAS